MNFSMRTLIISFCFLFCFNNLVAQIIIGDDVVIDYANPVEYELGGITISGVQFLDNNILIMLSGLTVGEKITIPGDEISNAIKNLWEQGLFGNIQITI